METINQPPSILLLALNGFLFGVGLLIVLTKKSIIFIILGFELMVQGIIANFILFDSWKGQVQGQAFSIFLITVSACEMLSLLALSLWLYKDHRSTDINKT